MGKTVMPIEKRRNNIRRILEASIQIIEKEGLDHLTIRSIASRAHCNSATLYNYFDNLEHIRSYLAAHLLFPYNDSLVALMNSPRSEEYKFYEMWTRFCDITFQYPKLFEEFFFGQYGDNSDTITSNYYSLFSIKQHDYPKDIYSMLSSGNIFLRNHICLKRLFENKSYDPEALEICNNFIVSEYATLLRKKALYGDSLRTNELIYQFHRSMKFLLEKI